MSFVSISLVALRESLEAFLILGILSGIVVKLGRPDARKALYLGALAGFLVSVLAGFLVVAGAQEAIAEGGEVVDIAASLIAAGILTYMIVWMYRHTIHLMGTLQERARAALAEGRTFGLAALSFVAVLREGVETAAFLATDVTAWGPAVLAIATGLGVAALFAALLFTGVVRLNLRMFFTVTSLVLVGFSTYLLAGGLAELAEEALGLGEAGEIGAWVLAGLYGVGMSAWLLRAVFRRAAVAATRTVETAPESQ